MQQNQFENFERRQLLLVILNVILKEQYEKTTLLNHFSLDALRFTFDAAMSKLDKAKTSAKTFGAKSKSKSKPNPKAKIDSPENSSAATKEVLRTLLELENAKQLEKMQNIDAEEGNFQVEHGGLVWKMEKIDSYRRKEKYIQKQWHEAVTVHPYQVNLVSYSGG